MENQFNQPNQFTPAPKTWLVESIIATVLCCMPAGIVGIIYAAKVEKLHAQGDFAGAESASKNAKTWTLVAAGVGIVGIIIYVIVMIFAGIGGAFVN